MDYVSIEFIKQLGGECISARNNDGELVPILSIDMLPAADVRENKRGEWIDVNGDGSLFRCNQCGDTVCCKGNNYCSNCGADMR